MRMGERKQPTPCPPEPGTPEAEEYTGIAPVQFRPARNTYREASDGWSVGFTWPVSDPSLQAADMLDLHIAHHFYRAPIGMQPRIEGVSRLGHDYLRRAQVHLVKSFERELTGRRERITTEVAAMAILRGVAAELDAAGNALDTAAEALRDASQGKAASLAKQAATRAHTKAGEIAP